jgi:hypothetical protein
VEQTVNIRDELLRGYETGSFLETVHSCSKVAHRDAIATELVVLHNEGIIDVVGAFALLKSKLSNGPNFFLTRHIFEKVLPDINAPVQSVMSCVLRLYRDAGQDLAAGTIIKSFTDFCIKDSSRPREALALIEANPDDFVDLLPATFIAGSHTDNSFFQNQALRLCEDKNIELRRRAVFSLGKFGWPEDSSASDCAISALELSATVESDDQILASIVKSAFALLQQNKDWETRVVVLIGIALSKGNEYTLHAASEVFCFYTGELTKDLLVTIFIHLVLIKPTNKGTLENIDCGISCLLKHSDPDEAIQFLEKLLITNPDNQIMQVLQSTCYEIQNNKGLISKILTRWFLRGDRALCDGVSTIICAHHGDDLQVEVDPVELQPANHIHFFFVARKSIGYLFLHPISCASFLISLMRNTTDDEVLMELGDLLFDPLLINFTGKVRDFVIEHSGIESGKVKVTIDQALKNIDTYLEDLRSVGNLAALHPGAKQRDTYNRNFSRLVSESWKLAESQSVLLSLVSKNVILYGRKSINYIYSSSGQAHRTEIPLNPYSTEMELPRMENIDPFGLEYILRIFRNERFKT